MDGCKPNFVCDGLFVTCVTLLHHVMAPSNLGREGVALVYIPFPFVLPVSLGALIMRSRVAFVLSMVGRVHTRGITLC